MFFKSDKYWMLIYIPAGHPAATRAHKAKSRLLTFNFLGFTCYWGISRRGFWILRFTSRRDRFASKLKAMKDFLRNNLTVVDTTAVIKAVICVVRGWGELSLHIL